MPRRHITGGKPCASLVGRSETSELLPPRVRDRVTVAPKVAAGVVRVSANPVPVGSELKVRRSPVKPVFVVS